MIQRQPKHIRLARAILQLKYQDQLTVIGEILAAASVGYMKCHRRGHYWKHRDETTTISYEPQIRAVCVRCGYDGGLI